MSDEYTEYNPGWGRGKKMASTNPGKKHQMGPGRVEGEWWVIRTWPNKKQRAPSVGYEVLVYVDNGMGANGNVPVKGTLYPQDWDKFKSLSDESFEDMITEDADYIIDDMIYSGKIDKYIEGYSVSEFDDSDDGDNGDFPEFDPYQPDYNPGRDYHLNRAQGWAQLEAESTSAKTPHDDVMADRRRGKKVDETADASISEAGQGTVEWDTLRHQEHKAAVQDTYNRTRRMYPRRLRSDVYPQANPSFEYPPHSSPEFPGDGAGYAESRSGAPAYSSGQSSTRNPKKKNPRKKNPKKNPERSDMRSGACPTCAANVVVPVGQSSGACGGCGTSLVVG